MRKLRQGNCNDSEAVVDYKVDTNIHTHAHTCAHTHTHAHAHTHACPLRTKDCTAAALTTVKLASSATLLVSFLPVIENTLGK